MIPTTQRLKYIGNCFNWLVCNLKPIYPFCIMAGAILKAFPVERSNLECRNHQKLVGLSMIWIEENMFSPQNSHSTWQEAFPKEKDHVPTIHFQVLLVLVSGRVGCWTWSSDMSVIYVHQIWYGQNTVENTWHGEDPIDPMFWFHLQCWHQVGSISANPALRNQLICEMS